MSTATQAYSPPAPLLVLRPAALPAVRRAAQPPAASAALWQQSLRVNSDRSAIERAMCVLLIVLAAAAAVYSLVVLIEVISGDVLHDAVRQLAAGGAR